MKITRTANAGVLIDFGSASVLIDGVCKEHPPYLGTSADIYDRLLQNPPDAVLYTHYHYDHYDSEYASIYKTKTLRPIYGSEFPISGNICGVKIKAIQTKHIGKVQIPHLSYIIEGEKTVWVMGDASPIDAKKAMPPFGADVLVVPYAYAISKSAWSYTKGLGAKRIILVHMPDKQNDPYKLWDAVRKTVDKDFEMLTILDIGETKCL